MEYFFLRKQKKENVEMLPDNRFLLMARRLIHFDLLWCYFYNPAEMLFYLNLICDFDVIFKTFHFIDISK